METENSDQCYNISSIRVFLIYLTGEKKTNNNVSGYAES